MTTFTGLQPVQVLLSQMAPDDFFTHIKGDANSLISPFHVQFISFFISQYSMMPRYPYCVTILDPLSFSSACILSHTRANLVVVFASAAVAALLSEQICILLLIMFLDKRSSVHLRFAVTSAWNTLIQEAAHKNISLRLSLCPLTPTPKWLLIPDLSMYQISTLGLVILPGMHQSSLVSINAYIVLPTDIFLRILSCCNVEGYFWGNSSFICSNPSFLSFL